LTNHLTIKEEPPTYLLGLDIGGTKTAIVLGNLNANIIARQEIPTPARLDFESAMQLTCAAIDEFLARLAVCGKRPPEAISIAVGGPLNIDEGILYSPPHLSAWGAAPLKQYLFQRYRLPVYLEHDGNAGALAEYYFGAGRDTRNLVFLTMGTGMGAGILINGEIYHGTTDSAGEVGHIRLSEEGPSEYGKVGSWEAFVSGAGIQKLACLRNPMAFPPATTTASVIQRALEADPPAVRIIEEVGEWLGKGMAILVDLLNPQVIVTGTLGIVLGDLLLEPARKVVQREALPIPARACRIVPAQLGNTLMDVGCLMPAIHALSHRSV